MTGPVGLDSVWTVPAVTAAGGEHRVGLPGLVGSLPDLLASVGAYLDLEPGEETYLLVAMCAAVSKALTGEEPLWVMLNGASGGGKTEAVRLLARLADARVDELTRAGLLSWAPGKKARRVGLLTRIPSSALVTISDFSTVATMGDHEARARMYAALRVVYDGRVYRGIGGEAAGQGDELEWEGHLTLVAACTPAIDAHVSFEAALGERWVTVRLPDSTIARARRRARFVLDRGEVDRQRGQAQELAHQLVTQARERIPDRLHDTAGERLIDAASLIATARTGVPFEGQGRYRVPVGIPTPEEPTRLVGQLNRLARCAFALGLTEHAACDLAVRVAIDSVPLARWRVIRALAEHHGKGITVADALRALGRGNRWAAIWELDALEAIGLAHREGPSRDEDPNASRSWYLSDDHRELYESVAFTLISPQLSGEPVGGSLRMRTPGEVAP